MCMCGKHTCLVRNTHTHTHTHTHMHTSQSLPLAAFLPHAHARTCGSLPSACRSMACLRANSEVDTECHWKGVCGFGVKLEMVTFTARCHLPRGWRWGCGGAGGAVRAGPGPGIEGAVRPIVLPLRTRPLPPSLSCLTPPPAPALCPPPHPLSRPLPPPRLHPPVRHSRCSHSMVSAMPITSASVSPGSPIMKYNLTCRVMAGVERCGVAGEELWGG